MQVAASLPSGPLHLRDRGLAERGKLGERDFGRLGGRWLAQNKVLRSSDAGSKAGPAGFFAEQDQPAGVIINGRSEAV